MKLPQFTLPANNGKTYSEQDFQNGTFILYIYPKDDTPGCTQESNEFQKALPAFEKLGVQIIGLSKDSLKSHNKFVEKYGLKFPLLSDEESKLIDALGAWKEKNMYGKKYMGAERSTFIIKDGKIAQEWRKVKVPGHVEEVLQSIMND